MKIYARVGLIGIAVVATACSAPKDDMQASTDNVTSEPPTATPDMEQEVVTASIPVTRAEDIEGAWQYRPADGDGFELIRVRDDVIDYETLNARQAGWTIALIDDGAIYLDYDRGPGVSAIDFPAGDRPLFETLSREGLTASLSDNDLVFSRGVSQVTLTPHPAEDFTLPSGQAWVLVESYDDLAERSPAEFDEARLAFSNYTAGAYAGCNHGGASFAQWDGRFIPGPHVMTQMACDNDGDAVAAWMLRPGPAFERDGDSLWRDFPEGRVLYRAQAREL